MGALDDVVKVQQDAESMSTEQLTAAFQQSYRKAMQDSPSADFDQWAGVANLIANRPGESVHDIDQRETDEDAAADRQWARQRAAIYETELKRRGLKPDWGRALEGSVPIVPDDGSSSADPHLDDLDTGHYDDGHAFGWKQPPAATTASDAPRTSGLPVPPWMLGIGGAIVLVIAAVGFAAARGGSTPAASVAPGASAIAAASSAAKPATNAPGVICADAPALSLALSGATTATVTKGCVPTLAHPGQQTSPATPYCRLQGIPNPPNTVAGVLAVGVAFVSGTTRFELAMSYVADIRDQANHGTLPATVVIDPTVSPAGTTTLQSWPATSELPGTQGTQWNAQTGKITFNADGASGTIDMTYKSVKDGSTESVKGTWQVAGGCPAVGK